MMRKIFPVSTTLFCYVILIIGTSCTDSKRITKKSKEFNHVEVSPLSGNPEKPFATMTPEEIRAYEIRVMRKIADLTLVPPKLNTSPLPEFDYDNLDYGMTIGIERTPKGRLWAAWVAGCDCPRAFMVANTSDDNGETWSTPFSSSINHPVARFHIRRLTSGSILLVKHGETTDTHEGRSKLTAWLSEDDGTSWKGGLMLDERSGISYPDGTQAPDGTIYITYDRERSALGEIRMARITENDILAGKLVTPGSKLKMLVSRPMKNRNE